MRILLVLISFFLIQTAFAQELFIRTEPASNLPKGVIGVRGFSELYQEGEYLRSMNVLRVMYGLSSKWTLWAQVNASDHHNRLLPDDLISDEGGISHTHDISTGEAQPMLLNGLHLYAKYLFFKHDEQNQHFRIAAFGEASSSITAHDEAEPNIMDDNAGVGAGLIFTELYKRFAVSLTLSGVLPVSYHEKETGIKLKYGKAVNYNLSLGYLLFPFKYKNYSQTNVSLYLEFLGRSHQAGEITQDSEIVFIGADTPALKGNSYIEAYPGIQFIFNSNTRLDLGMGFKFWNKSYRHTYPLYFIQVQHYFYRK